MRWEGIQEEVEDEGGDGLAWSEGSEVPMPFQRWLSSLTSSRTLPGEDPGETGDEGHGSVLRGRP